MDLSVVVPVYNEAENVQPLIDEVRAALEGRWDYEVIFVNDGSRDETLSQLKDCRYGFPRLRILDHAHCCGQSTAIHTGVRAARAPWIVTLDGDGQNDPADIPNLYAMVGQAGTPTDLWLVTGWRKQRRDSALKRLSSRVANGVRRRLLGDDTPDTGCGLKLFRRDVFLELPYFDHMHRFLPALVQRAGGQVVSVSVRHRPRATGTSKYGIGDRLWVGILDMLGVMWLQRRVRLPLVSEVE